MKRNVRALWPVALFFAALAAALCAFAPALPVLAVLRTPDSPADFTSPGLWRRAALWLANGPACLNHGELLGVLAPPLAVHELRYAASAALQALALAAYLRLFRLPAAACCGGGLALALAGYNFTLFNAGHRGYAEMMPYGVFLLALVESAVRRPSWPAFVLAAVCAACGLAAQPDVMSFVAMLAAAYAVFRVAALAAAEGAGRYFASRARGFAFGAAALAVSFAAFGHGAVKHVFTDVVRDREAQIEASSPTSTEESPDEGRDAAKARERWIFATNWSLPPEDVAEFVAPDLRGRDSGNPEAPYWGRLGRTFGWSAASPSGFPNFRQHSLYFGAPVVAIALFALVAAGAGKGRDRGVVVFWGAAAAVSLLLALGRHGFLYRAFYALPMMDSVRAPVKFVHLAEISVAALFGFGLARMQEAARAGGGDPAVRRRCRGAMLLMLAVACALAVASAVGPRSPDAPSGADVRWAAALARGALLFALSAASVGAAAFARGAAGAVAARALVPAVVAVAAADLAAVASRYVSVEDASARADRSAAAEALLSSGPADGRAWSYILLSQRPLQSLHGLGGALDAAGFSQRDPYAGDGPDSSRVKAWTAFGQDFPKLWAFWGTAGVFVRPETAVELARGGMADVVAALDISGSGVPVTAADPRRPRFALVAPRGVTPSVGVWHDWNAVRSDGLDDALAPLSAPSVDVRRTLAVFAPEGVSAPEPSGVAPESAEWKTTPLSTDGRLAAVSAEPASPGLLFVREDRVRQFWPRVGARVNGESAPVLRANGMFLAVPIPAGRVDVEIFPILQWWRFALAAAGWAAALAALAAWTKSCFGGSGRA